jgi:hypothetical protein
MSNAAVAISSVASRAASAEALSATRGASDYLGPARVLAVRAGEVEIELPDGAAGWARLALAFPYQPAPGDELLVIGKGEARYVIGVLHGRGQTVLAFQGGVEIRAEGGPLSLASDRGLHFRSPEIGMDTGTLRMAADAVVQRFTSVFQRVSALLSVRAREMETVVDEGQLTRAKSASILTEETMSINGKQIHLG